MDYFNYFSSEKTGNPFWHRALGIFWVKMEISRNYLNHLREYTIYSHAWGFKKGVYWGLLRRVGPEQPWPVTMRLTGWLALYQSERADFEAVK